MKAGVHYNVSDGQTIAKAKENAKSLNQIFSAMEQINPRLRADGEDAEMADEG